ncbi:hypothetical protein EI613_08400 [Azospirillum sp. 412522]|nr:hypothetical protein [Azospirillum sp. 412522]
MTLPVVDAAPLEPAVPLLPVALEPVVFEKEMPAEAPEDTLDCLEPLAAGVWPEADAAPAPLESVADPLEPACLAADFRSSSWARRLAVRRYSSTTRWEGIWSWVSPVSKSRK